MGGHNDFASQLAEHALGHQLIDRVVFHQQDARPMGEGRTVHLDRVEDQLRVAAQVALQNLVQRVAAQRACLLLQGGKGGDFLTGHEVAIGGDQQNGRANPRAQAEQAFWAIGNQQVGGLPAQIIVLGIAARCQPPMGQQRGEQLCQAIAAAGDDNHLTCQGRVPGGGQMHGQRQVSTELAAKTDLRADTQPALHGFTQVVGQRQPKSRSAKLACDPRTGLGERLEDLHLRFLGNTDACVADLDFYPAILGAEAHIHAAEAGELQGIGKQVADDLPHTRRVAYYLSGKEWVDQAG